MPHSLSAGGDPIAFPVLTWTSSSFLEVAVPKVVWKPAIMGVPASNKGVSMPVLGPRVFVSLVFDYTAVRVTSILLTCVHVRSKLTCEADSEQGYVYLCREMQLLWVGPH